MQKLMVFLTLFTTLSCMADSTEVKILHYNIKELDSFKIRNVFQEKQLLEVKNILQTHEFDILSLNEIQYDLPNVPNADYITRGQNLQKLKAGLGLNSLTGESFNIANTGLNAKTKVDGTYYLKPNTQEARAHADQVNFGTVPGQYSTGALFKYKKINEVVVNDLKWKDFNPNIDLTKYKSASGKALPEDIELFDKNFTDITLDVNGKELHLILLHTVPSFHFGNKFSVNYVRNAEQLKFLEWYLTGSTDFTVNLPNIKPLDKNAYYVATGDWNTEYSNTENPGSTVLRRLFHKSQLWLSDVKELSFTNEGGGYMKKPFRLMLDYIAYSTNIEMIDAKIIHPSFDRKELGCETISLPQTPKDYLLESYKDGSRTCHVFIHKSYKAFKEASDHYPIWGHFKLK